MRVVKVLLAPTFFLMLVTGCDEAKDEAPKTTTKTVHECTITIAKKAGEPEKYKGRASGTDEGEVEKQAWEAACAALPEADRSSCRDNDKFRWGSGGGSSTVDGVKTYSRTITLTRVVIPEEHEALAKSDASADAACEDALAKACEAANAGKDCVASGPYEQRGRRSSKKTETVES